MASYLLRNDGLFVGSSAAMNCVGAVKAARRMGPGHVLVTVCMKVFVLALGWNPTNEGVMHGILLALPSRAP